MSAAPAKQRKLSESDSVRAKMSQLQRRIEEDLKTAMKQGDAHRLSVLRMVKSAIIYARVDKREGFGDDDVLKVLRKEAKQRQDSADIYEKGGAFDKRDAELAEKAIVEEYLPAQMTDEALGQAVDSVIAQMGPLSPQTMGRIIGAIKQKVGDEADGSRVASFVKQRLDGEAEQ